MPRRKFGLTSLEIHLATARKRNTRTSKRTFPSRIVGVTGMHKLWLESQVVLQVGHVLQRTRKEERKKENENPFLHFESVNLARTRTWKVAPASLDR